VKDKTRNQCRKCRSAAASLSRKKNAEKYYIRERNWVFNNSEKVNKYKKKHYKKSYSSLDDGYIKQSIRNQFKILVSEITPELIELKRIELTNKRLIKKLKENETK